MEIYKAESVGNQASLFEAVYSQESAALRRSGVPLDEAQPVDVPEQQMKAAAPDPRPAAADAGYSGTTGQQVNIIA